VEVWSCGFRGMDVCVCVLMLACVVVDYICRALPDVYIDKLFSFVASQLADSSEKGFYVTWNQLLLESHGARLKQRSLSVMPTVNDLQKSLRVVQDLNKMYALFTVSSVRFPDLLCLCHPSNSEDIMLWESTVVSQKVTFPVRRFPK